MSQSEALYDLPTPVKERVRRGRGRTARVTCGRHGWSVELRWPGGAIDDGEYASETQESLAIQRGLAHRPSLSAVVKAALAKAPETTE